MSVGGIWLLAWTNAVAWRRAITVGSGQMGTNRDLAGVLASREADVAPVEGFSGGDLVFEVDPAGGTREATVPLPQRSGARSVRGPLCRWTRLDPTWR